MKNNKKDEDLDELNFEETPLPDSIQARIRGGLKPIRGIWTIPNYRPVTKWRTVIFTARASVNTFLSFCVDIFNHMRYTLYQNISERIKITMSNKTSKKEEKVAKDNKSVNWDSIGRGIMSIGLLFTVASITASSVIIFTGTEGILPKIIIAPMTLFAAIKLVTVFVKNAKQGNK